MHHSNRKGFCETAHHQQSGLRLRRRRRLRLHPLVGARRRRGVRALHRRHHRPARHAGRRLFLRRRGRKRRRRHGGHGELPSGRDGHSHPALSGGHGQPAGLEPGVPQRAARAGKDPARRRHARLRPGRDRGAGSALRVRHHGRSGYDALIIARRGAGQTAARPHGLLLGCAFQPLAPDRAVRHRAGRRDHRARRPGHPHRQLLEDTVRHIGHPREPAARRRAGRGGAARGQRLRADPRRAGRGCWTAAATSPTAPTRWRSIRPARSGWTPTPPWRCSTTARPRGS